MVCDVFKCVNEASRVFANTLWCDECYEAMMRNLTAARTTEVASHTDLAGEQGDDGRVGAGSKSPQG